MPCDNNTVVRDRSCRSKTPALDTIGEAVFIYQHVLQAVAFSSSPEHSLGKNECVSLRICGVKRAYNCLSVRGNIQGE